MPLIRGHHSFDEHYTQIPNDWLRDERLSLSAIGLLAQLMSHAPGWTVTQERLAKANNIGRDGMRTILNELMSAGYLLRSEQRERNGAGQLAGYVYTTSEPTLGEPTLAEPTLAEPLHKKNSFKEEHLLEEQLKEKKPTANEEEIQKQFDEFWALYPKKLDKGRAIKDFRTALKRATFEVILTGVTAYKDDPYRKPQFTKYPSSWLNADAWDNYITSSEGRVASEERRTRELASKEQFLAEQRLQEAQAAPAPKCEHGNTVALCRRCLA